MRQLRAYLWFVLTLALIAPEARGQQGAAQQSPFIPSPPGSSPPNARVSADIQELERLEGLIGHFEAEGDRYRLWGGLSGLAIAAVAVPVGIVVMDREEEALPGAVILGAGIGAAIGAGVLLVYPSGPFFQYRGLSETIRDGRAANKPAGAIIASIEAEWQERAGDTRVYRKVASSNRSKPRGTPIARSSLLLHRCESAAPASFPLRAVAHSRSAANSEQSTASCPNRKGAPPGRGTRGSPGATSRRSTDPCMARAQNYGQSSDRTTSVSVHRRRASIDLGA